MRFYVIILLLLMVVPVFSTDNFYVVPEQQGYIRGGSGSFSSPIMFTSPTMKWRVDVPSYYEADNFCFRIEIHLDGYRNCSPIYVRDVDTWQELEATIYQFDGFLTGQYYFRVCYKDPDIMSNYKEIYRQWHVYFWLPPVVNYSLPYNPPSTSKPTPTLTVLNKTSGNGSSSDPFHFDGSTIQFRIGATGQNLSEGGFLWAIQALGSTEGSCFRSPTRYWKSQTSAGDTKLSANQAYSGTYGSWQEISGVMSFDFEGDRCIKSSQNTFLLHVQAIDKWGNYQIKSWEVYYYCGESVPKGHLGNLVWYDLNKDGIQDEDEPGVYGVKVTLNDGSTARTNEAGLYTFYNIDSDDYTAHFTEFPEGYTFTAQNQGGNDLTDSDADADGFTAVFTVPPDGANTSVDAGLIPIGGEIGDRVWLDQNVNGVQEPTEPGIADVGIQLFQADDAETPYRETYSDSAGNYGFPDIGSGEYFLQFACPEGYAVSQADAGEDDALDSDADFSGQTAVFTLTAGDIDSSWDAGFYPQSVLDFDASQLTGKSGMSVQFTNKTQNNGQANYWDFGDGYQTEYQTDFQNYFHPLHKYTQPGEFDVTLRVENPGHSDSLRLPGMIYIDDALAYLPFELTAPIDEAGSNWENLIDGDIYGVDCHVDVGPDKNTAVFSCVDSSVYEIWKIRVLPQAVNSMVPYAGVVNNFRLLASLNGNTFFPVLNGNCQAQNGQWECFELEPSVAARYVKVVCTTNQGGTEDRFSLAEMQFFGTVGSDIISLEKEVVPDKMVPGQFFVSENYPNPFNPETRIEYQLPETATVTLEIFNIRGQCLATPINAMEQAVGQYSVVWNAPETIGQRVSSGVYFYRLRAEMNSGKSLLITRKMTYLP